MKQKGWSQYRQRIKSVDTSQHVYLIDFGKVVYMSLYERAHLSEELRVKWPDLGSGTKRWSPNKRTFLGAEMAAWIKKPVQGSRVTVKLSEVCRTKTCPKREGVVCWVAITCESRSTTNDLFVWNIDCLSLAATKICRLASPEQKTTHYSQASSRRSHHWKRTPRRQGCEDPIHTYYTLL